VKEPNMFHNYETEKITRKASDAAENLQLYRVVRFFHPRSSCSMNLMLFSERPPIYGSLCMTISGGRTKQHVIIGFGELAAVDSNQINQVYYFSSTVQARFHKTFTQYINRISNI